LDHPACESDRLASESFPACVRLDQPPVVHELLDGSADPCPDWGHTFIRSHTCAPVACGRSHRGPAVDRRL
jgi:hypothetical protein